MIQQETMLRGFEDMPDVLRMPGGSMAATPCNDRMPLEEGTIDRVESLLDSVEMAIGRLNDDCDTGARTIAIQTANDNLESLDIDSLLCDELNKMSELAMRRKQMALSVCIPVFNERETIREIVKRVKSVGLHQEIVIVDDGSTDGTREILAEMANDHRVRVILHECNQGKGAALRTAFAAAKGEIILVQDADLEYDPNDYMSLVDPIMNDQCDVVYGSRYLAEKQCDPSRFHRFGNWLLTAASNLWTGQKLTDMETCYKVFRRSVLESLIVKQNRFGFEPEITAKVSRRGFKIREVPIAYDGRSYKEGKKIGMKDAVNAFYCIVRYGMAD